MSTVYEIITEQVLERLAAGVVPWRKPWRSPFGADAHANFQTRKPYRGINACLTNLSPYACPYWLGFKQAKDMGLSVRKGEHSTLCVYAIYREDEDSESSRSEFRGIKYSRIFNLEQLDGAEALMPALAAVPDASFNPIPACEAIVAGMPKKPAIAHDGGSRAYYWPSTDSVSMPLQGWFESAQGYYAALFHELAHSTGHESRLSRPGITELNAFGSSSYSKEELCAEFTAAFVGAEAGITPAVIDNTAAYIDNWHAILKRNPTWLYQAAQQAQKAADWILDRRV